MKRATTAMVIFLILFSLFSYPLLAANMTKSLNSSKKEAPTLRLDEANNPDVAVTSLSYSYVNGSQMIVSASVVNYGNTSEPFNTTFIAIEPQELPEPSEVPFTWIDISQIVQNAVQVYSGEYVSNWSAVLHGDDSYFIYKLPFVLNYFGRKIVNISVSTNGYIELLGKWEQPRFRSSIGIYPDLEDYHEDVILALDGDLETDDGYLAVVGFADKVVIEWFGSTFQDYNSADYPINVQVIIFRNGTIRWSYKFLRYSSEEYNMFAGYFSKVSLEDRVISQGERKSFEVQLPEVTPLTIKSQTPGLLNEEETTTTIMLPIRDFYVEAIADNEEELNDYYRFNNIGELWIWPGDYWIENATIGNLTVGEYVEINFTVKSTSHHPETTMIKLLMNNESVRTLYVNSLDFINGTARKSFSWRVQGGKYSLMLELQNQGDINTENNLFLLGNYSLPQPNFKVLNYSISIPNCVGDLAVITANVTNDGDANWSDVEVKFVVGYSSSGQLPISRISYISLPAGDTKEVSASFSLQPGNISWIYVQIDPYDRVIERNENDNILNETYMAEIYYPDFTVESIYTPTKPNTGNSYTINITIDNLGQCYNGGIYTYLYENGSRVGYKYVTGILTNPKNISIGWTPREPGLRNLTVVIDPYNSIPEKNEANNALSKMVFVGGPDLIITNVTLLSFDGMAGSTATFNVTIKNTGEAFTDPFYVVAKSSLGSDYEYIRGMNKNEEKWIILQPIINGGSYNLTFIVDYTHNIPETYESNNMALYPINVPRPNFIIERVEIPDNTVGNVPINITIKNIGAPYNATRTNVIVKIQASGYSSLYFGGIIGSNESVWKTGEVDINPPGGTINVTVNPSKFINETHFSDNSYVLDHTTGYPDLTVKISVPNDVSAGERIPVNVTVKNIGNATLRISKYSYWYYYLPLSVKIVYENGETYTSRYELAPATLDPNTSIMRISYFTLNGGLNILNATVDENNRWKESNESNNYATVSLNVAMPDFVVSNYSIQESLLNGSAYLYKTYSLPVNVTNNGANFSSYVYVQLLDNGKYSSSRSVGPLNHGETKEAFLYYIPAPGQHLITLLVDPGNNWIESNETNNNRIVANLSFGYPELVPLGVTWTPYNFTSGDSVTFKTYIKNTGQAFYRSFSVRFEVWNETSRLTYGYGTPNPYSWYFKENETKEFDWRWYNAKPGNLTLKIFVDYYNAIPESNESNNEYEAYLGSIGTPDFELSNLTVENLEYGRYARINVNLRNLGEAIYKNFPIMFNISNTIRYVWIYGMNSNESKLIGTKWYVDKVGNITIQVRADPNNAIIESDEDNNEVSGSYYIEAPDLVISSYKWIEDDLSRGYLTFNINVTNNGGNCYRGFYVGMYIDGEHKADAWIPSLMKGETKEVTVKWHFNVGGTHNVTLRADTYDTIEESDENNNEVNTQVTIALPDLTIESISLPENMNANAYYPINITIRNDGLRDVDEYFTVAVFDGDRLIGSKGYNTLKAGQSTAIQLQIRPYPGNRTIKAIVDYYNHVYEVNESNNEAEAKTYVSAPNLKILSVYVGNYTFAGDEAVLTATLENTGDAEAKNFYIGFKAGDVYIGAARVESLAPNSIKNVSITWKIQGGEYPIYAIADYGNYLREWNESDNTASTPVKVPTPDLTVSNLTWRGEKQVGAFINFSAVISNIGNPTKQEFYVSLYVGNEAVDHVKVNGLEAGASMEIDFHPWKAKYGNLTVEVKVDTWNFVTESNENNNVVLSTINIKDISAPTIMQMFPANGSITNRNITGVYLVDDGAGVDYSLSKIDIIKNGTQIPGHSEFSGGWLVFIPDSKLGDGEYTVRIKAVDKAGNSANYTYTYTLDTTPPRIKIEGVSNGATYNSTIFPQVTVMDIHLKEYSTLLNGKPYNGEPIKFDGSYVLEVTASDEAGNSAHEKITFTLNGIPLPPSSLTVKSEEGYAILTWKPSPSKDVLGYFVYVNGVKVTPEPIERLNFTLPYQEAVYEVSAVDFAGHESEKVLAEPIIVSLVSPQNPLLAENYPANLTFHLKNMNGAINVSVDIQLIDSLGNVIKDIDYGRLQFAPNETKQLVLTFITPEDLRAVQVIVSNGGKSYTTFPVKTYRTSLPNITISSILSNFPEVIPVNITNFGSAELTVSGSASLGRITGETNYIRLKPGENGTLYIYLTPKDIGEEILTLNLTYRTFGDAKTFKITKTINVTSPILNPITLSHEQIVKGKIATVFAIFKNLGSAPLTVNKAIIRLVDGNSTIVEKTVYKTARLYSEGTISFYTTFVVPANAPDYATLEVTVYGMDGYKLNYSKREEVQLLKPPYNANVTIGKEIYSPGETIHVTGYAFNESGFLPNVTVKLSFARDDFVRTFLVKTDSYGRFTFNFTPYATEGGTFVISATHPKVISLEHDAQFKVLGIVPLVRHYTLQVPIKFRYKLQIPLRNVGDEPLNITVTSNSSIFHVDILKNITLMPGEIKRISVVISSNQSKNETFSLTFRSRYNNESVQINIITLPEKPILRASPKVIDVGVKPGEVLTKSVEVENLGFAPAGNVTIILPNWSFVTLASNFTTIEAGEKEAFTIFIAPTENNTGKFTGYVKLSAKDAEVKIPIRVIVTPNQTGNVRFILVDPEGNPIPNGKITISNEYYTETKVADKNGTVLFSNVPVGLYKYYAFGEEIVPKDGNIIIDAGIEKNVTVILLKSPLKVEFEVYPVTVDDVYTIVHEIEYETYLTIPYLKVDYGQGYIIVNSSYLKEHGVVEFRGYVTIQNTNPYLSVVNVTFRPIIVDHYTEIVFAVDRIDEIKPGENVTVPYVIRVYQHRSPDIDPCKPQRIVISLPSLAYCEDGKWHVPPADEISFTIKLACVDCFWSITAVIKDVAVALSGPLGDVIQGGVKIGKAGIMIVRTSKVVGDVADKILNIQGQIDFGAKCYAAATSGCQEDASSCIQKVVDTIIGFIPVVNDIWGIYNDIKGAIENCGNCLFKDSCVKKCTPIQVPPINSIPIYIGISGGGDVGGIGGGGGDGISYEVQECEKTEGIAPTPQSSSTRISKGSIPDVNGKSCAFLRNVPGEEILPAQTVNPNEDHKNMVCTRIKLEIRQRLTMERQGFRADLKFTNLAGYTIRNLTVYIKFFDENGTVADDKFFVRVLTLEGINSLNGSSLVPNGTGIVNWLIIPKPGAAGALSTHYTVKAYIFGKVGNTTLEYESWPEEITVEPMPILQLDYMLPRYVYGDNPKTPEVEPPIPFVFGVRVKNIGYGDAKNLRIESAQPKIISSNVPAYISFRIIGTYINGIKAANSLTVDFGDIPAGESATAAWIMTAQVSGEFVSYNATFIHEDLLGGNETSLIRTLRTHTLFKAFNDTIRNDGMMDFLVDDNRDLIPERIIDSTGADFEVLHVNATMRTESDMKIIVPTAIFIDKWTYIGLKFNPGTTFRIVRSDGSMPVSYWYDGKTLHILDYGTPEFYYIKSNRKPVAQATITSPTIANRSVTFDASLSYDPDGKITDYAWKIGNLTFHRKVLNYTFTKPGIYNVTLTVRDDGGLSATKSFIVTVYLGPRFTENFSVSPKLGVVPFNITAVLNVTNSGDAEGIYSAAFSVDGKLLNISQVSIQPDTTYSFEFRAKISEIGYHNVTINNFTQVVEAYKNVSISQINRQNYSKYFGYYNSLQWDEFKKDFENWSANILSNITLPVEEFDRVIYMKTGNWSIAEYIENLNKTEESGWIKAVYTRNVTLIGITKWNYTELHLTQVAELYGNATHKLDVTAPSLTVSPSSGIYQYIPEFNVTVCDESNVTVWGISITKGTKTAFTLISINNTCSLWRGILPLDIANNTVTIIAEDEFGNRANETLWIYINPTTPIIYIESPKSTVYNKKTLWFNYTVIDTDLIGVRAYLDGTLTSTSVNVSKQLTMDYGYHNFTVTAWDVSYNVSRTVIFRINKPPIANFTWTANHLRVNFTSTSTDEDGIIRYLWDFGDGSSSNETNPTHVYPRGGRYNVTLTVWDAYSATSTITRAIQVFANVSENKEEKHLFTKYFGFYNTSSWEPFREDFGQWSSDILKNMTIPEEELDSIYSTIISNWSLTSYRENLIIGASTGWINATYRREVIIKGFRGYENITLSIIQTVHLFGNATHVPDTEPPEISITYPENKTYDHNITLIKVQVYDVSPVKWVRAELDGRIYPMNHVNDSWLATVNIGDGKHLLTVYASDVYGNTGYTNITFTVNTSIRIVESNNTTVQVIPGEAESQIQIGGSSVTINISIQGVEYSFIFHAQPLITVDERINSKPWMMIYSNAQMGETEEKTEEITQGGTVYRVRRITIELQVAEDGYAVLVVPLHQMKPTEIKIDKDGVEYKLTREKREYGYFGVFGDYLYIVVFDDPVIKITMEEIDRTRTIELHKRIWTNLGIIWEAYYLRMNERFNELEANITNISRIQKALSLHKKAQSYFDKANTYDPRINPAMYAIYMRKAYITEKRALKLLIENLH